MASTEPNVDIDKEEPKWNAEDCDGPAFGSPPAPLCNKPLDFSQVTPSQLGISTQSFIPSSLGKDKSRLTQLKARRRSTVGARGSPETNSLIRYIAQQRQKTPPSTPQPLQASPFVSRGFSSLKQKMASFQNLLEVEENQGPAEERDADGRTSVGGKENRGPQGGPRRAAPPSSKKRRMGPFREVVTETREATPSADILSPLFAPGCPEQSAHTVDLLEVMQVELRQVEVMQVWSVQVEARQACSVQVELRQVCSEQVELRQVCSEQEEEQQVELMQVRSEQTEELQVELRQVCSEQVELRQVCSEQMEELQVELRQVCSEQTEELQVELRQVCSEQVEELQVELRQACSEQTEELQVELRQACSEQTEELQVELRQACSEQVEELQVELRQVCSEQTEELQVELRQACSEQVEELQVELRQVCSEEPRYTELTSCEMEEAVCCSPRQSPVPWSWDHNDAPFTPTHGPPTEARRTPLTEPLSPCMLLNLGPADTGSIESPFPLTEEGPDCTANSARPKKKRVHFGVPLSPEFFDKRLPPSTPLQKGGTPAHPSASGGGSGLRSLLKTPQKSALSLPQPDFGSPSLSGPPSPPPSDRRGDEAQAACAEEQGQLAVPVPDSVEEEEEEEEEASGSGEDAACSPDVAPAAREEAARREARSPDATPVPPPTPSGEAETGGEPETELAPGPGPAPEPPVSAARPGRPRSRKRKQAEGTAAAAGRRPSRSAAVAASGKMKMKASAGKRGWGSKAVDRSLYGKRDYASKNPVLSPITESLPCASRSPTPLRHGAAERLPEDCREPRNPSIPLAQTGPSVPAADLVTAASLWRSRFGVPARNQAPNDRPDDHEASNDRLDDHEASNDRLDDHEASNDRPDDHETSDDRPDDHEASDDRPDDHEASDDRPDDHEASNDRPDDHEASNDRPDDPSDCAAEAASAHSQERRGGRLGRPRGGRGGRGKGRREPALSSRNGDDQTVPAAEPELPVCSPAGHHRFPGDRFPGDRQESNGLKVEEERHGDEHGAGDSAASEPDAGGGAPEPAGGGGRRSNASRRSGAKGRPKGRRSSLYLPPPLSEEHEEAQSPQTLLLPGGEQSEGEGAVRAGEGGEISHTATEREGEGGSGETGRDGIGPPALPPADGADGVAVAPPPWQQAEFCIEDVLQAPPRGGRRSVRRSLRNQSLQDPSAAGLAWVPSSSPTDRRPARRRTRGRRSSAHAPPTLPEDVSPPEARC